jgi:secreted trypsin-like serine protease
MKTHLSRAAILAVAFAHSFTHLTTAHASLLDDLLGQVSIIGGAPVASADPIASSTVALLAGGALCTASIIEDDIAVTAAHCVDGARLSQMKLVFARSAAAASAQVAVIGAVMHARYRSVGANEADQGDIALVRFAGGIPAGYRKAKLLTDLTQLRLGGTVTLAGFGITQTHPHTGSGSLRKTTVEIAKVSHGATEILFDQREGQGACHGDSGGPAFVSVRGEQLLFGVTNRGFDDDRDTCGRYAVYTKIQTYKSWISAGIRALRKK